MTNKITDKEICFSKMEQCKILFTYSHKNRRDKQIYTVNTSKTVLIGGLSETGYMLNFWPENTPSHTCMTYNNILRILAGKIINQHVFEIRIIK